MDNSSRYMELIDRYLENLLTGTELEEFERLREEDSAFREMVADMEVLVSGIRSSARESMMQEIRGWESSQPSLAVVHRSGLTTRIRRIAWTSMAAAASLAALFFGILRAPAIVRVANAVFKEYNPGPVDNDDFLAFRSGGTIANPYQQAFQAYDLEDFKTAAELFSSIPEKNDTLLFYLGNSWFATRKYQQASDCFKAVMVSGNFRADAVRWYQGLTLLKLHQVDEAKILFTELSDKANSYQDKAKEILVKLNPDH